MSMNQDIYIEYQKPDDRDIPGLVPDNNGKYIEIVGNHLFDSELPRIAVRQIAGYTSWISVYDVDGNLQYTIKGVWTPSSIFVFTNSNPSAVYFLVTFTKDHDIDINKSISDS